MKNGTTKKTRIGNPLPIPLKDLYFITNVLPNTVTISGTNETINNITRASKNLSKDIGSSCCQIKNEITHPIHVHKLVKRSTIAVVLSFPINTSDLLVEVNIISRAASLRNNS
jgi:hypothetical protein